MLVLAPTRELASQIAASAEAYGRFMRLSVGVIFGGVPNRKSVRTVSRGLDVLVATPGRLLDLIDQRALSLRELEILVLDEADQMLDLGFIHALKRIVALVPAKRQTLFFSATMPRAIKELADKYLTNPAEVSVTPAATTVERVEQSVTMVNQAEKTALLTIVPAIARRRAGTGVQPHQAWRRQDRPPARSRRASPRARSTATRARRSASARSPRSSPGEVRVLIATDIAARGIDIPGVSHVVNFDLPDVPEQYVHRIGRTARAGADGHCDRLLLARGARQPARHRAPDAPEDRVSTPLPVGLCAAQVGGNARQLQAGRASARRSSNGGGPAPITAPNVATTRRTAGQWRSLEAAAARPRQSAAGAHAVKPADSRARAYACARDFQP